MKCDLVSETRGWCSNEAKWSFSIPHGADAHGGKKTSRYVMCDACKAEFERQIEKIEGTDTVLICTACGAPVSREDYITNILPL